MSDKKPNAKIVSLVEYRLTAEELSSLPARYSALLSLMCHAINEMNVFAFLFLSSGEEPKDPHLRRKWKIQRNTILRALNSKIFEALKGITDYRRKLERSSDSADLLALLDEHLSNLQRLRQSRGFETASFVRNKTTNHFLPSMSEQFMPYLSKKASRSLYLHNSNGDSFYPLGEEVMFDSAIHFHARALNTPGQIIFDEWLDWVENANSEIVDTFTALGVHLITEVFPNKVARERKHYVATHLIEDHATSSFALFHTEKQIAPDY